LFLLPTKFGERLLSHHFDAKIAALKHEQEKELGKLHAELDHLKDRGIRSNEREYDAVSTVWESFVEAFLATKRCVVQFMSFPDLNKLSDDDAGDFLRAEGFTERETERVIISEDRNRAYSNAHRVRMINLAGDAVLKVIELLQKQSAFVPQALAIQFDAAINLLNDARLEQYMARRPLVAGQLKLDRSMSLVGNEGRQTFEQLRDSVRNRLLRDL
jgi:molybdopterin-guanine dinucleotide biosynthesis protein